MSAEDLLKLPWDLQVPLASGYAAYVLAYTGLRDRQKTVDVAFISLVFSLIATGVLALAAKRSVEPIQAGTLAFAVTVASGAIWRKFGRPLVGWSLRAANITWANDDPSALASLSENTKCYVTQVAVQLDDGSWLSCQSAVDFTQAPFGPFQLGPSGDIALYVTDITEADGTEKPQKTLRDSAYGDRITYVPAARIKRITVRYLRKPSRSLLAGVTALGRSRPEPKEPSAAP
ncbi:hypothetical protein H8A99_34825 [Bradyrhizobium sp. Arg68]|uniref:hypothetical protein n=1 Tax=Bradyrhizobium ivorense TaxID=2511166 RepID=UPI001E64BA1D|nr:hypothetical protein [Bradyrhizobium ivorense]MCC8941476.1 hypothetical protein [Bradyrhizobium ivorense]